MIVEAAPPASRTAPTYQYAGTVSATKGKNHALPCELSYPENRQVQLDTFTNPCTTMTTTRLEHDLLGDREVPAEAY